MGFDADGALYAALLAEQAAMCTEHKIPRIAIADVMRSLLHEALEVREARRTGRANEAAAATELRRKQQKDHVRIKDLNDVMAQCVVDDTGCWLWTRSLTPAGYAQARYRGSATPVHRISYELEHGAIPVGMVVDHICRVRRCANPKHLRLLTRGQNVMADGSLSPSRKWADRTHCSRGHEFTPENTKRYRNKSGRVCITCKREDQRKNRA